MKKVLILGAEGMLGQELKKAFLSDASYEVFAWDRDEVDVTDFEHAAQKILALKPAILINAVAYNAVDACEESDEEYAKALLLNQAVPKFLATLCKAEQIILLHYSTDYVFGGNTLPDAQGFDEATLPQPECRYAVSKRLGEEVITALGSYAYYIVRLSKLFGKPALSALGKKSFFDVMLSVGQSKPKVEVVDDEVSCFTYAPDLAQASKALIESGDAFGVYHLVNEMPATWYDGVMELYRQAGLATEVVSVGSDVFSRPAKRPHFSVLHNTKRPGLRPYTEALTDFLEARKMSL
jgi:dTDP-4-dehydrorhamnose reductase